MSEENKTKINAVPSGRSASCCYAVWDLVWMMHYNKPTQVRIVEVNQKGFSRKGWCGVTKDKEIITEYKVTDTLRYHDFSSGVKAPSELFSTKRGLLDSLA